MDEATLLWVGGDSIPSGLYEQVEKRQVFLEETTVGDLFATLQLVGPDLVVYAGKDDLAVVADVAEGQPKPVPLVVLVDRKEHRTLRQTLGARIGALLPTDLPLIALAQRLSVYVQRAKKGQPLELAPFGSAAPVSKPALPTPAETKPAVAEPPEPKPSVVAKPAEPKPSVAAKPIMAKPAEAKPSAIAKPVEAKPVEVKPVGAIRPEPKPVDAKPPIDAKPPVEAKPPIDAKPAPPMDAPLRQYPVRLALIDDDLGRADPIARELRARGYDVRLVSPEHGQARWTVLRRFAPHGLIVDERSLSKGTRQIVGAFRRDPFLRYVPLVTIGFARLYRESDQAVHLAPLLPHLEPLARAENSLPADLSRQGEVTVEAVTLGPARLVEVLGDLGEPCVLSSESGGRRLALPLSRGRAGEAELTGATDAAGAKILAEEALEWLLAEEDPVVTVTMRPMLRLERDVAVAALIERLSANLPAPPEFSLPPPPSPDAPPQALSVVAEPTPADTEEPPEGLPRSPGKVLRARLDALGSWLTRTPPWSRLPRGMALPATAGALFVFLALVVWLVASSGKSSEAAPLPAAKLTPPKPPPPAEPAPAPTPILDRFRVAEDAALAPCAQLVSGALPGDGAGTTAFNRARKALMAGDVAAAEADLCRSVLAAPTGPAAEALAEFYLGRRAVSLAKRELEPALAANPERRKAIELMADVRAYEGDAQAARELLLGTLGVSEGDTRVLAAVARKFAAEGDQAARGGDLPRAERLIRRAALLVPDDVGISLSLAAIYGRSGMPGAAQAWAERVLELSPGHGAALVVLGDLARVRNDTDEARRRYGEVKPSDPAYPRAAEQLRRLP
jgi:Flp pilus assembly protein TadD